MGLSVHLMSIKSFGILYMSKIANLEKYTLEEIFGKIVEKVVSLIFIAAILKKKYFSRSN